MSKDAILTIINLIQNSGSAVSKSDLYALLPKQTARVYFEKELIELESDRELIRIGNLFSKDKKSFHERNREISRKIFKDNRNHLKIFSFLPWVRFISLTGSNAFESCNKNDDIDMFVISAADRLWLLYVIIVIISKLLKKRPFFCFNYLIDEKNIALSQQSYHNAVQIYMMKPLFNSGYKKEIYQRNPWIIKYLPNSPQRHDMIEFYRLRRDFKSRKITSHLLTKMNNWIFQKYNAHLTKKYPYAINKGILLGKGHAKLHQNDKSHMYDKMMVYEVNDGK